MTTKESSKTRPFSSTNTRLPSLDNLENITQTEGKTPLKSIPTRAVEPLNQRLKKYSINKIICNPNPPLKKSSNEQFFEDKNISATRIAFVDKVENKKVDKEHLNRLPKDHKKGLLIGVMQQWWNKQENTHRKEKAQTALSQTYAKSVLVKDLFDNKRQYVDQEVRAKVQDLGISHELFDEIAKLDEKEACKRAVLAFRHAILSKKVRISSLHSKLDCLYAFNINSGWQMLLTIMSWMYLLMIFFEPVHSSDFPWEPYSTDYWIQLIFEIFVLTMLLAALIIEISIRSTDKTSHHWRHAIFNGKTLLRIFVVLGLILDFILYMHFYTNKIEYFRFGKLLRPINVVLFSLYTRRYLCSIIKTWKYIFDLLLLLYIMIVIFSLVAVKMVRPKSDLIEKHPSFNAETDLTSWGNAQVTLYFLTTLTNYPTVIFPYMDVSHNYFYLFLSYILIVIFIIIPIPVAMLFDQFKQNRGKLILKDKLKKTCALVVAYSFLDTEGNEELKFEKWKEFLSNLFEDKLVVEKKKDFEDIFFLFDINEDRRMNRLEFLAASELVLSLRDLNDILIPQVPGWKHCQLCINKIFHLSDILRSHKYEIFRFIVILGSLTLSIIDVYAENEKTIEIAKKIDMYVLYLFTLELSLRIIAYGPVGFLNEPGSLLDTFCVIVSYYLFNPINFLRILKYPRPKSLKATTTRKDKMEKNKCKYNPIVIVFESVRRIRRNLTKVFLAFPAVNQLILLVWFIFYTYAVMAIEYFYKLEYSSKTSIFDEMFFGNFTTFPLALITLFQILTQSGWHQIVLNYEEKDSRSFLVIIFFASFHFLIVVILSNLIIGLVWEVLTMIQTQKIQGTIDNKLTEEKVNLAKKSQKSKIKNSIIMHILSNRGYLLKKQSKSHSVKNLNLDNDNQISHSFDTYSNQSVSQSKEFPGELSISSESIKSQEINTKFKSNTHQEFEKSITRTKAENFKKTIQNRGAAFDVNPNYFWEQGLLQAVTEEESKKLEEDKKMIFQHLDKRRQSIKTGNFRPESTQVDESIKHKSIEQKRMQKYFGRFLNYSAIKFMRHLRESFFARPCISGINKIIQKMHSSLPKGVLFSICQIIEEKVDNKKMICFPYYEDQGMGGNPTIIKIPNILDELKGNSNTVKLTNYFRNSNQEFLDPGENASGEFVSSKLGTYKAFSEISNQLKSGFGYLNKKHYEFDIYIEIIKSPVKSTKTPGQSPPPEDNSFYQEIPKTISFESIWENYIPNERTQEEKNDRTIIQVGFTLLIWIIPIHIQKPKTLSDTEAVNPLIVLLCKEMQLFNIDLKESGFLMYWRKYIHFVNDFYEALERFGRGERGSDVFIRGERNNREEVLPEDRQMVAIHIDREDDGSN